MSTLAAGAAEANSTATASGGAVQAPEGRVSSSTSAGWPPDPPPGDRRGRGGSDPNSMDQPANRPGKLGRDLGVSPGTADRREDRATRPPLEACGQQVRVRVSRLSVMICHRVVVCPQVSRTADTHPSLRRMQSPTDPADRTGTIGVEAFDATYGAGFQASDDSPHAVECELVEDAGAFVAHRPTAADRPRRVAFVDGTLRTEARLTHTGADGDVSMGLVGSWAAGAVLVDGDEPARFDQVTTGRAAIFTGGRPVHLPHHRDGWRWEPYAVDGADIDAARQQLQRLMRDAEADIAEALSNAGWLTVLDGPLSGIGRDAAVEGGRPGRGLASGLCVGAAPGRAGPSEPDADRGSRTAPASPPG